ncbi:phosphate transporter [Gonapodya prolifera JEL478]|uniref:Phosphate transporter n=1 Tax=Gonapodya prolifera (strain JEL478) TaxID=1344416 RepID=A0A139AV97_GONPJ|nr:phosphate transporter [Gonapodya prolifera JEL478]|eukprot:KXS20648.1 phosphate transporter [Gonapodya prolifera JEL478]
MSTTAICPDGKAPNPSTMQPRDYTWLFALGLIQAFLDAYGIGANDVANSFATAVASKTISLRTACIIATFAEFLGALLLGKSTAETIRNGIITLGDFQKYPELLMLGMWCALIGSSTWVLVATSFGMPVSTTHSIVGAIIGMGIATYGSSVVIWNYDGVAKIVTSWFTSPIVAAIAAVVIYLSIKFFVMKSRNPFEMGLRTLPIFFFVTIGLNLFYVCIKGAGNLTKPESMPPAQQAAFFGGIFGAALLCAAFAWFFYVPWLRRVLYDEEDLKVWHIPVAPFIGKQPKRTVALTPWGEERMKAERAAGALEEGEKKEGDAEETQAAIATTDVVAKGPNDLAEIMASKKTIFGKAAAVFTHGTEVEVANHDAERFHELHDVAIKYDSRAEELYSFLQIFTCTLASFAHGANDVANAIGPLSLIYLVWSQGGQCVRLGKSVNVEVWILAFGGIAIDIGLLTYGYNVMRSLGNHITYHSPSRGFSMELGAGLTVLTASYIGLPVSTTHCITGATAGVGLCNARVNAINWKLLAWCFFSWIITLPIAGGIAAIFMAIIVNAPRRN